MSDVEALAGVLGRGRLVVLTGAGCSTESGIPDYRGPETARRARNPIPFRQFAQDPAWRARYWARSLVGWRRVATATPNPAHRALARLERTGRLGGLITQNVDGLHQAAGSRQVVDLHGRLSEVVCLNCGAIRSRSAHQQRLLDLNPGRVARPIGWAPDGDADLPEAAERDFRVADCGVCGGILKPNVVFFGENVPRHRVERAYGMVDASDGLLVVGTSLTVFSGLRFVKRAAARAVPIGIVNLGATRGDGLASVRVDGRAGQVLPALLRVWGHAGA